MRSGRVGIVQPLTVFLARLIGLTMILVPAAELIHGQTTIATMTAIVGSPPAVFVIGTMFLIVGLAIVLGHNVWRGGVLPVVVTVIGWLLLLRGLLLLVLPLDLVASMLDSLHLERYFYLYATVPLIIGIFLTYAGFRAR
jgi:hypothetical protein